MIGLPGDFTPPSRFVRAVAFSQDRHGRRTRVTRRSTSYFASWIISTSRSALAEGTGDDKTQGMRSATIWTTAYDTKNLIMYYHTQHNRRVRKIDLNKVGFEKSEIVRLALDKEKKQDIEDVTPHP